MPLYYRRILVHVCKCICVCMNMCMHMFVHVYLCTGVDMFMCEYISICLLCLYSHLYAVTFETVFMLVSTCVSVYILTHQLLHICAHSDSHLHISLDVGVCVYVYTYHATSIYLSGCLSCYSCLCTYLGVCICEHPFAFCVHISTCSFI